MSVYKQKDLFDVTDARDYHKESQYHYLSTNNDKESINARNTIRDWIKDYPDRNNADFLSSIMSYEDDKHQAFFFELYIYTLFNLNGFNIHRGGKKLPDFHINGPTNFHCECTLAGSSIELRTFFGRTRGLNGALKSIKHSYSVHIKVIKSGEQNLNITRLTKFIRRHIDERNDGEILNLEFKKDNWILSIDLYFKPYLSGQCILGSLSGGFMKPMAHEILQQAIQDKLPSHYNFEDEPYIIGINSLERGLNDHEINGAIFGDDNFNSFFSKNKNTSVSGILLVNQLYPQWVESRAPKWIPNPWAKLPIDLPNLTIGFSKSESNQK